MSTRQFPGPELARAALVIVAGLAQAAAFPKAGVAGLAWIAPGLVLFCALGEGGFRLAYLAGLAFHLAALHWLLFIPVKFAPIGGWLALSAYLALYTAVWVWLCELCLPRAPNITDAGSPSISRASVGNVEELLRVPWLRRCAWAALCAAAWVATEMVQARLFSGFPWNLLGASQYKMAPLIQVSSITGVYGVSFLVVWFSVSLGMAGRALVRAPHLRRTWQRELLLPSAAVFAAVVLGWHHLQQPSGSGGRLARLALIQPSIPQKVIWNPDEDAPRFAQLLDLSQQAMAHHPELVVWPEAAVPTPVRWNKAVHEAVTSFARTNQVWMVLGSDDMEVSEGEKDSSTRRSYNSSFLVNPRGELIASYDKRRLVAFGEYVPLGRWLPFLKYLTPISGGFTPGKKVVPFQLSDLGLNLCVLICFEDVFPHAAREYVREDTSFLVNVTNNGWFGESAAQWQHAANAVFRAIENGCILVRCANNGLTCWVDERGILHDVYFKDSSDVYKAGFKIVEVPVAPKGERRRLTFYGKFGDVFGWTCLGIVFVCAAARMRSSYSTRAARDRT